jgi:hypothetical protein
MKTLIMIFIMVAFVSTSACDPKIRSQEDQEVIKGDSLNPQEGAGEGEVPDEVIR